MQPRARAEWTGPLLRCSTIYDLIIYYLYDNITGVAARKARGRGGRREGSGRKRVIEDAVTTSFKVAEADLEALRELAEDDGRTVGDLLRQAVTALLKRRGRG